MFFANLWEPLLRGQASQRMPRNATSWCTRYANLLPRRDSFQHRQQHRSHRKPQVVVSLCVKQTNVTNHTFLLQCNWTKRTQLKIIPRLTEGLFRYAQRHMKSPLRYNEVKKMNGKAQKTTKNKGFFFQEFLSASHEASWSIHWRHFVRTEC